MFSSKACEEMAESHRGCLKVIHNQNRDIMYLLVKKLVESATIPERKSEYAVGYDLTAVIEPKGGRYLISTGIAQLIIEQCKTPEVKVIEDLPASFRGERGFDSI